VRKIVCLAALVSCALLVSCSLPLRFARSDTKKKTISAEQRLTLVRRAQVWTATNVASMNILAGPPEKGFGSGATVTCDYVDKQFGGHTPKFGCAFGDEVLKVRYGRDNGEVYAGVAATRLLWALGFGADPMYPVRVVCRGCPEKLAFNEGSVAHDVVTFDVAAIERKFPGTEIEATGRDPGWSWDELDAVDPRQGGAPPPQRDALKLVAVLLQHTDNKADQQHLVCRDREHSKHHLANCEQPFMLIHDVGMTFGRANLLNRAAVGSVNFEMWSTTPIWKDREHCIANLAPSQTGSLADPPISEAGRKFLADLLVQLSDKQLHDLFAVSRFADKPHGGAPIDAWVAAFKEKRNQIVTASCS
jgi:hypothetical protein